VAQLNMFLGQNASDAASDWVSRVKADEGDENAVRKVGL
jgi:hypothetical protein